MKILTTLLLIYVCNWVSIDVKKLKPQITTRTMIVDLETLELGGSCGGTEHLIVEIESFRFCNSEKEVEIIGHVKTSFGEPYPNCKIGIGNYDKTGLKINSNIISTDLIGYYKSVLHYDQLDELLFFDIGAPVTIIDLKNVE